jgi:hypothetical protein
MLHFGHTPGALDVTSGCIGQTYVTPASLEAAGPWWAWASVAGGEPVAAASNGTTPSGPDGLDGSFFDVETGAGPGEQAVATATASSK